jgi:hypothetical protein
MAILLAFAPFIAFALIDRLVGPTEGLIAGAVVSLALLVRDRMTPGRAPKFLRSAPRSCFAGWRFTRWREQPPGR